VGRGDRAELTFGAMPPARLRTASTCFGDSSAVSTDAKDERPSAKDAVARS